MKHDNRLYCRITSETKASLPDDYSQFVRDAIREKQAREKCPEFWAIVNQAIPLAYERYRDPKNRAKGPIPTRVEECLNLLQGEIIELAQALEGNGDVEYEAGDVLLCALAVANAVGGGV